jgi:hypothetical protein
MTRVLVVGYDPNSADFTGPALPRGIDLRRSGGGKRTRPDQLADHLALPTQR